MSIALNVPQFIIAKSPAELQLALRKLQAASSAKFAIVAIYYDGRNHVLWYQGPYNSGGSM